MLKNIYLNAEFFTKIFGENFFSSKRNVDKDH